MGLKLEDNLKIENHVLSNLPLQMSLYFNVYFCPFWMTVMTIFRKQQYDSYTELYKFLIITMMVMLFIIEILRLYLGYEGNLKDKTPELAGFFMLSLVLQLPLQSILLCHPYFKLNPVEIVMEAIMIIFLCTQLICSYYALKYTAGKQAEYFKSMKIIKNKVN